MEPALQLTLQRLDFLLKGVVDADLELLRLSVLLHARLHHWVLTIWLHAHLLLEVLDEGRLVHRDAVLALQLVSIVDQEWLVSSQLLLDGLHRDFVDRLLDLESLHRLEELFGDIEDVSREEGPLALGLDQGALGVFLFLLQNDVVSLQKKHLFF
jgi:hypothetical protein